MCVPVPVLLPLAYVLPPSPSVLILSFAATQAYCQAEAHGEDHNPDLHFNKAIIAKYKADYEAAHAGFARAHSFDPSLQVDSGAGIPFPHPPTPPPRLLG